MSLFQIAAVLLSIMAVVGWINTRTLRAPQSAAMLGAGVGAAGVLFLAQAAIGPFWGFNSVRDEISRLNFTDAVLGHMLAFLLFSGGMQVDVGEFNRRRLAIFSLSTVGVVVSTALVGAGVWWAAGLIGIPLPLSWALVFGALISPTDAVAVMANVRSGELSRPLGAVLQGEALFNDGMGLVIFTAALAFAQSGVAPGLPHMAESILIETGGGLMLGVVAGLGVSWIMRAIDDHVVELTASLALAVGVYALGQALHVSGPIAAGAAGLVVGSWGSAEGMSERTREHIHGFWRLVDEVLNGLLFLLMGLQIFVAPLRPGEAGLWAAAIVLAAAARLIVVLPWGAYFRFRHEERSASLMLVWGGLRGAISLALALSLPAGAPRDIVVATTFAVVSFSVLVQGLTFARVARWLHVKG